MNLPADRLAALLAPSHDLGAEGRDLAILGEGNTSARAGDTTFLVKASGSRLGSLGPENVIECRFEPVRDGVAAFRAALGTLPRVILLASRGVITLGSSPQAVLAAMLMVDKAARIFAGAAALGGPGFLPAADVDRIANRADEHYRQRALRL